MITLGLIGAFQNGKSTFANCLLGGKYALTGGEGVCVTSSCTYYSYGDTESYSELLENGDKRYINRDEYFKLSKDHNPRLLSVTLNRNLLKDIQLIDTPGFNANEIDTQTLFNALDRIDAAIVIISNKQITQAELNVMKELQLRLIPFIVIMNCYMQSSFSSWNPFSEFNNKIAKEDEAQLKNYNLTPIPIANHIIIPINLCWYWFASELYLNDNHSTHDIMLSDIKSYNANKQELLKESRFSIILEYVSAISSTCCDTSYLKTFITLSKKRISQKEAKELNAQLLIEQHKSDLMKLIEKIKSSFIY